MASQETRRTSTPTRRTRTASSERSAAAVRQRAARSQAAKRAQSGSAKSSSRRKQASQTSAKRWYVTRFGRAVLAFIAFTLALACAYGISAHLITSKYTACERWRGVTNEACEVAGLDTQWTDALLAAMVTESGGDTEVESVLGVDGDVMQAAEGKYGWIVHEGWPDYGIQAETPEASIYAGTLEFKQNLELWQDYLGGITPEESQKIQLVIQGYNFGADGWYAWCEENGITSYSVESAELYSDTVMPADAKGTPTHAEKWLEAYDTIRSMRG